MKVQKYDIIIMDLHLSLSKDFSKQQSLVLLCKSLDHLSGFDLNTEEKKYLEKALKNDIPEYSKLIHEMPPIHLRDLLGFKSKKKPISFTALYGAQF